MFLYQKLIDRSTLRQGFSLVLGRLFIAHRRKNAKWNTAKRQMEHRKTSTPKVITNKKIRATF